MDFPTDVVIHRGQHASAGHYPARQAAQVNERVRLAAPARAKVESCSVRGRQNHLAKNAVAGPLERSGDGASESSLQGSSPGGRVWEGQCLREGARAIDHSEVDGELMITGFTK